jgi:Leucine-rich repeat (LRR) protein
MQCSHAETGPTTITLKDYVITSQTEEVDLPHAEINDEDIVSFKDFHGIKTLILGENKITNFGLFTICNSFAELRKLFINHNQITDDGVASIPKLKNLRCLDLRCNKISSQSLKYISKLLHLNQLSISNNSIDDSNLK